MSLRIATEIELDHFKLVKVRCCGDCPNILQIFREGKDVEAYCDLLEKDSKIVDTETMLSGCPLPKLLDISLEVGKLSHWWRG